MKATGVVRRMDGLGRIVIPKEIRRTFDWVEDETALEIFIEDKRVILGEYRPGCVFCNSLEGVQEFKSKMVCGKCRKELK